MATYSMFHLFIKDAASTKKSKFTKILANYSPKNEKQLSLSQGKRLSFELENLVLEDVVVLLEKISCYLEDSKCSQVIHSGGSDGKGVSFLSVTPNRGVQVV